LQGSLLQLDAAEHTRGGALRTPGHPTRPPFGRPTSPFQEEVKRSWNAGVDFVTLASGFDEVM
jgi:hypothetical protein